MAVMVSVRLRRRVAELRQPPRAARIALGLWIAWAAIVWNLVFDRVIVLAGRAYVAAAIRAAAGPGPFLRMDAFMRPAVTRGLWFASTAAAAIIVPGVMLIRAAARQARPF
jgi:hypothetical protein